MKPQTHYKEELQHRNRLGTVSRKNAGGAGKGWGRVLKQVLLANSSVSKPSFLQVLNVPDAILSWQGNKQDLSPDRITRLILHILFLQNSKSVTLVLTCPCAGVGGGGGGAGRGIALRKSFIKPKMNQIGAKVENNEVLKT